MGKRARLDLGDCDERSTYASFVAAANAVSQLYAQGQAQQKRAAITASKAVLVRPTRQGLKWMQVVAGCLLRTDALTLGVHFGRSVCSILCCGNVPVATASPRRLSSSTCSMSMRCSWFPTGQAWCKGLCIWGTVLGELVCRPCGLVTLACLMAARLQALESSIIPASAPPAGPGNTSAGGGTTPAGAPTAEEQAAGSGKPSRYHATIPVASGRRGIIGLPGPESVHGNLHHPQHLLQQQMLPPHLLHQVHTHHACLTSEPGSGDGPMDVLGSLSPPPPPLSAFSQAPGACGPMQGQALLPTSFMQGLVEGTGPGSMH
jgi:hypothetical protein